MRALTRLEIAVGFMAGLGGIAFLAVSERPAPRDTTALQEVFERGREVHRETCLSEEARKNMSDELAATCQELLDEPRQDPKAAPVSAPICRS